LEFEAGASCPFVVDAALLCANGTAQQISQIAIRNRKGYSMRDSENQIMRHFTPSTGFESQRPSQLLKNHDYTHLTPQPGVLSVNACLEQLLSSRTLDLCEYGADDQALNSGNDQKPYPELRLWFSFLPR
jgi:hypothetical protein